MFRKFWLDTILGTLFIFAFMGLIANISSLKVFDLFDPIGDAFADMETTDIVFSQMRDQPNADEDILLVNIGQMPDSACEIQIIADQDLVPISGATLFPAEADISDRSPRSRGHSSPPLMLSLYQTVRAARDQPLRVLTQIRTWSYADDCST